MTDEGAVNWLEQNLLRETYKLKRVEIPVFCWSLEHPDH